MGQITLDKRVGESMRFRRQTDSISLSISERLKPCKAEKSIYIFMYSRRLGNSVAVFAQALCLSANAESLRPHCVLKWVLKSNKAEERDKGQ